jgi:hypothetical protein
MLESQSQNVLLGEGVIRNFICGGKDVPVTRPQVPCVTQKGSKELDLRNWLETWCRS